MSRRPAKSIYGSPSFTNTVYKEIHTSVHTTETGIGPSDFTNLLQDYIGLVDITSKLIKQFFPAAIISSTIIADMAANLTLSPSLFTRLLWAQRNKGTKFLAASSVHLAQLKDIYIEHDMNWMNDPVLKLIDWSAL